MTITRGVVYNKSMIFKGFGVYLSEFLKFLHEIFFGRKILPSSCDKHQNFDYGCSTIPDIILSTLLNLEAFLAKFWKYYSSLPPSPQNNVGSVAEYLGDLQRRRGLFRTYDTNPNIVKGVRGGQTSIINVRDCRYPGNEVQGPDFGHFLTILGIFWAVCLGTSL